MERKAVTAVEFVLLAGMAVFLIAIVTLFARSNVFSPSMNQTNQTGGAIAAQRKCFQVDCADVCDGTTNWLNHSAVCIDGRCVYRGRDYCPYGCLDGRCLGAIPVVNFVNSSCGGTCARFTSTSTDADGKIVSYYWDFGDGSTNTTTWSVVDRPYVDAGTYNVTLTVIDNSGLENSTLKNFTVPFTS